MDLSSRPLVLDASAALAYLHGDPGHEHVERLVRESRRILVPWLFWYEIANVLGRRRNWSAARVMEALYDLEQLWLETRAPDRPSLLAAVDAVEVHGLTSYDAVYLVLAEQEDASLLTADADLAAAAGTRAIPVVAPHRLADASARYESHVNRRPAQRESWSGAAAYLGELRQRIVAEDRAVGPR